MKQPPDPAITENRRLLRLFFEATRIPVSVFCGSELLEHYLGQAGDFNIPMFLRGSLPQALPPVWYAKTEPDLFFGGISWTVPETDSPFLLFLGPVLPYDCSPLLARQLALFFGRPADFNALSRFFGDIGNHDAVSLRASLQILCRMFGLFPEPVPEPEQIAFRFSAPAWTPAVSFDNESSAAADMALERRLLSYVRRGYAQPFLEMKHRVPEALGRPQSSMDPLFRHYTVSAITLASRTAIEAGVDEGLALSILVEYLDKILRIKTADQLSELFPDAFLAFTRQVERINQLETSDPLVLRVHAYICGHLYEKLTPAILSEALGYNTSYLCARFKQVMGDTISTYVNRLKILEARQLLELTDQSIADIAASLGYPSCSYFCSVFKKNEKQSPGAYRASLSRRAHP